MRTGSRRRSIEQVDAFDARFADRMRLMRQMRNISRRQLAERTGIPVHTIEKIETGYGCGRKGLRRRASIGEAIVLAEALGVKPGDLLRGGGAQ